MASTLNELLIEIQELVEKLEVIGFGNDDQVVTHNSVSRPTLQKVISDKFLSLSSMIQGRKTFKTKADLLASGAPAADANGLFTLADVWNDSIKADNGTYGYTGSAWVKSSYDPYVAIDASEKSLRDVLSRFVPLVVTSNAVPGFERGDYLLGSDQVQDVFRGWSSPFNHNGSEFDIVQLTLKAEVENHAVDIEILDSALTVLARGQIKSVGTVLSTYGVVLDRLVTGVSPGDVLHISYRSADGSAGLSRPFGSAYDVSDADPAIHKERIFADSGTWSDATPAGLYRIDFRVFSLVDLSGSVDLAELSVAVTRHDDGINGVVDNLSVLASSMITPSVPAEMSVGNYAASGANLAGSIVGWQFPFKHNGTGFNFLELSFRAELDNTPVTVQILDAQGVVIVSSSVVANSGFETHRIAFPEVLSLADGDVGYIAYYSTSENVGLGYPAGGEYQPGEVDPLVYGEKILVEGQGWSNATPAGGYRGQFRLLSLSKILGTQQVLTGGALEPLRLELFGDSDFLVMPPYMYSLDGQESNLYFDNIVRGCYSDYHWRVVSGVGTHQAERYFTKDITADDSVEITCLSGVMNTVIDTVVLPIRHAAASGAAGKAPKCLFIGDSTTAPGLYTGELLNLAATDVMGLSLHGTLGADANLHEGRGGWTVSDYYSSEPSPFVFSGVFDFSQYANVNSIPALDYVFVHLGINDMASGGGIDDIANKAQSAAVLADMDLMIANIKSWSAATKICVMVTIPPSSSQDAFGANYGADARLGRDTYKRTIMVWVNELIAHMSNREGEGIYLVPVNLNLDTVHNMSSGLVEPANARTTKTVIRQSNGVHPSAEGYNQMADSVWSFLKWSESQIA